MTNSFDNKVYDLINTGSLYSAGTAIDINSDKAINVKIDNDSIKTNDSGQLCTPNTLPTYAQSNDYMRILAINYLSTFIVMNIAVQIEANHSTTLTFSDDIRTLLHNHKPFYVQCLSHTHSITSVDNNKYEFTNGGSLDFSNDNSIIVTIGTGDTSYNFNFIAYYIP